MIHEQLYLFQFSSIIVKVYEHVSQHKKKTPNNLYTDGRAHPLYQTCTKQQQQLTACPSASCDVQPESYHSWNSQN